ncbi:MAG: APC family permease [Chloroflexi bacterium]|nr:APC family permease [Chloroflexota bacterium]MCI0646319.1 APC family permease [Chloroflexota bacterium]MCI0726983.1 APC family permease [Chloroflexota bacterium]
MSVSFNAIKRLLIGQPFPTRAEIHERLDKIRALAIFASDPISSNAYATEAIMSVLLLMGSAALSLTLPVALGIVVLVLLVVFSYIQTILHYPDGGGAYTVTKDNLGVRPSLLAAGALLTDYVLTVSVSVSAGVRAVTSAFPETFDYRVWMALAAIALLTWVNLRGVRESGTIFAFPTYAFVGGVLLVIIIGLVRYFGLFGVEPIVTTLPVIEPEEPITDFLYIWLILRAFAAGCTALTGIEAISNGTQAFKPPESRNAAKTMVVMGLMAMSLFIGISFLATHLHLVPMEGGESILSQMTRTVAGGGVLYYWVTLFTTLILFLAANTGYQDFPRLSSFLANDGFLPRWLQNRGDRLVFSWGILVLAFVASLIVIIFQADEIAMLPLYALGVMLSFTLSQFGMVRLMGRIAHLKPGETMQTQVTTIHYESGWWWKRALNFVGGTTTLIVLIILIVTKFKDGAWVIVLAIPVLFWLFRSIRHHYQHVAESLRTKELTMDKLAEIGDVVIVSIADVHRGTLRALRYAKRISKNVRAVSVVTNREAKDRFLRRWNRFPEITGDVELVLLEYEYRDILTPLVEYIEHVNNAEYPNQLVTVVIPEFVPESFWAQLLHNQTANLLRFRLRAYKDVIVIDVPFHIPG